MAALLLGILFCLLVFLSPVFVLKTAGLLCHAVLMAVRYMGRLSFSAMSFSSGMKVIVGVLMLISVIVFIRYTGRKAFVLCSAVSGAVIAASLAAVRLIGEDGIRIALLGKKNIDVIVADENSNIVKSSSPDYFYLQKKLWANMLGLSEYSDKPTILVQKDDYILQIDTDARTDTDYMEMFGFLDNGNVLAFQRREKVGK